MPLAVRSTALCWRRSLRRCCSPDACSTQFTSQRSGAYSYSTARSIDAAWASARLRSSQGLVDHDRGLLRHIQDGIHDALAADAALLIAAERNVAGPEGSGAINHHAADFEPVCHAQRIGQILREHARLEPVWRIVGNRDGAVGVAE